jgi:hypothetical protein
MSSKWLLISCTSIVFVACVYGSAELTKYFFAGRRAEMLSRSIAGLVKEGERRGVTLNVGLWEQLFFTFIFHSPPFFAVKFKPQKLSWNIQ